MSLFLNVIRSMRIKQWIKNLFMFAPIIFGGKLFIAADFTKTVAAFFIFCLVTSATYIINDIADRKKDRFHPEKQKRPIASGALSVERASFIAVIFILISGLLSARLNISLLIVITIYILLHLLYSFMLKREVILDVIIIALGFELRIWAGAVVINIIPSVWLQLCVFILAIFLGLIKRRHEKISLYGHAAKHRAVLMHYKVYFLDHLIMISATLCVVFYGLYTVSPDLVSRIGSNYMAYTIPFVIYGIFRYLYLIHARKTGGNPGEILMSDIPLMLDILLWILAAAFLVYSTAK